jgi:hypothetical protein
MSIKSLRRSYENLTMLERLSLVDNAISRDDESELHAIKAASPKETYSQPDFYNLLQEITTFRLCNLIVRLGYAMDFDYFLRVGIENLKNLSKSDDTDTLFDDAKLAAYLYVRETDAWNIVNTELCLRPKFDEEIGGFLFSVQLLERKDRIMRKFAFSEDEVKEPLEKRFGKGKMKTIAEEANSILKGFGLATK